MQRDRRRDPYPWTWEIPTAIAAVFALAAVTGVQLGRGLANLAAGAGWTWPAADSGMSTPSPIGAAFWTSLPGVLAGRAEAGLARPVPDQLAGPGLLCACIAATEVVLAGGLTWLIVYAWQRWGPGRLRGMASTSEAEKLLGVTRLRKVAPLVRPDLYGKQPQPAGVVHRSAGDVEEPVSQQMGKGLSPWLLPGRFNKEHQQ